jgi:cytochrome b involved in lipid metabolism
VNQFTLGDGYGVDAGSEKSHGDRHFVEVAGNDARNQIKHYKYQQRRQCQQAFSFRYSLFVIHFEL